MRRIQMKNIRIYHPEKYNNSDEYIPVEPDIYKTISKNVSSGLSLSEVTDKELAEKLKALDGWEKGTGELECRFMKLNYEGKRYYIDTDSHPDMVMISMDDIEKPIYVTSLMFEQEPEYDENDPSDAEISQYPLEDILDKFFCMCEDWYDDENESDPVNSYMEFSSDDIEDIKSLLSIVGKHVYNKEDGDYVILPIE